MYTGKTRKLEPYPALYTDINYKFILVPILRAESIIVLEIEIGVNLCYLGFENLFL